MYKLTDVPGPLLSHPTPNTGKFSSVSAKGAFLLPKAWIVRLLFLPRVCGIEVTTELVPDGRDGNWLESKFGNAVRDWLPITPPTATSKGLKLLFTN